MMSRRISSAIERDRHSLLYAKVAGISAIISTLAVLVGWVLRGGGCPAVRSVAHPVPWTDV
jgi:hypothetical protein